jgi:TRAP-type C4-dicarboxylate transport system substrate-binding protein
MPLGRRFAGALLALCALGVGLVLAGCGSSSSTKTLTLGYVTTPTHPYGLALTQFAAQVAKESGGKLKIKLIPDYGGGNDATLLTDLKGNTVNMGSVSASIWDTAGVTAFQALQMPFLITNYTLEKKVLDSSIESDMLTSPEGPSKLGLHGLAIHEGGLRKPVSTGACITTLAGFSGKKMRVAPGTLLVDGIKGLGAVPTPMALSEVYLSLKSGLVNSLEANYGLVYTNKYYEVAKCITGNVNLWPFPTVLSINNTTWNGLTSAEQGWITTAADKLPDESIAIVANPASPLVKEICATGMKIGKASASALTDMRNAENGVYAKYTATQPTGTFVSQIEAIKATVTPPTPAPLPAGCAG